MAKNVISSPTALSTFTENKTKGLITMEELSMPQSILQIVSEKGFDGLREINADAFQRSNENGT